jgi:hypothetical protein
MGDENLVTVEHPFAILALDAPLGVMREAKPSWIPLGRFDQLLSQGDSEDG